MAMIDQLAQRVNNTVKQSQNNRSVLTKVADFFTDDDLDKTKYLGEVSKAREDIWNSQIMPKLKAAKANDATVSQAYRTWSKQVDDWSSSNGFKLRQGQSVNQQRQQNMVQKLADTEKSGSTSDKVAAKAKVAKVVTGTGLKSVQVGGLRAVGSIAQYVADAGETDRNSKRQKVANYVKRAGDEAKASNIAYQDIEQNGSKVSKVGLMAGEQVAPLVLTGGVAGATTKGALALGAGVKGAAAAGIGASTAVSYTQNYGDVRQGVEDEFRNATANQLATSKDPNTRTTFNSHYTKYLKKGLSQPDAAEQARLDTISDVAESYAEDYGKLVTALEPISAGVGKFAVKAAGGVAPNIVGKLATRAEQRAIGQAVRGQTSKVANATAMTKSATSAIGRSAAEEGLQEGLTDWASQKAAVDSGIKASNDWGQTKEAAVYGAILGGLFGGAGNIATGQTGYQQAKSQLSQIQQTQAATNAQLNTLQQQHSQLSQVANPTPEQKQQIQAIESNIHELETVKYDNEANAQRLNIPEPVLNKHVETPYSSTLNPQQAQADNADNPAAPDTNATAQTASPTDTTTNTSASPVNPSANPANPSANGGFDVNQYLDLDANSLEQAWVNHQKEMADNATITDGTDQISVQDAIEHANNTISEENTTPQVQGGISGVVARNQQRESQTILDNEMADWQAKKQQLQAERDAKLAQEMNTPDEPAIKLMDVNDGEHFDTTVIGLNGEPFRLANAWDSAIPAKAKQQAITTVFGGRLPQKLASASWGELHPQAQKKLHTWFTQELNNRRSEREQLAMPQLGMRTVNPQPVNELPSGNEPINLGFGNNQALTIPDMPVKQQSSNILANSAPSGDLFSQNSQDSQASIAAPKDVSIGADGKPKWFSTAQKANEFIAKKKIGDTHQVMQTDNKRFEILPKAEQTQTDINTTTDQQVGNQDNTTDKVSDVEKLIGIATKLGKYNQKNTDIILKSDGKPFSTLDALERAIKNRKLDVADYDFVSEGKQFIGVKKGSEASRLVKSEEDMPTPDYGSKVAAKEKQSSDLRLQTTDVIGNVKGKPFKVRASAEKFQTENNLETTHEIKQVDGGFELHRLPIAKQNNIKDKANGIQDYTEIQSQVAKDMGIGVNADGEYDVTDEQFAEMNKRIDAIQREQRGLPPSKDKPTDTQKAVLDEMQKSGRLEIVGLDNKPKAETPTSSNDLPIKNIGDTITAKSGSTYRIENINYTDMGGISSVGLTLLTFKDGSINPNKNPSIGTFTMGEFNRMFGGDFDLTPMPTAQDKTDNQADNAAKQRPSQSQGDGASVGKNESQVAPKTENELAQYFANKLSPNLSVADIEDAIRDEIYLESRFNNPAVLDIAESEATYTAFAQKIKDLRKNREPHSTKYEQYQSPIISDDTFENTQQQTNGAKEIKFESNKNYQFEYDVNAALDADGFNQEGDFLRLDYKNKNQPLSAAKAYGARVFFSYNQTTGKVSSIVSVYTDSTHKRSIKITNEPNNQYPKVKFETEFYKPLFDVVAKDERAFQDYIDSGKWQAEKDAKREQIKQNFIDNKPAIFTDLAKKYMSASLVDLAGVETAEQFRGLSDESQAEAFAKLVEQTGYVPPKKKSKPTNVKEGIAKIQAEKKAAKKDKEKFADNKVFTADKVAAARARMKSKLSQLNSGLDPELMMDGMTIAGAYIESGVRKFGDYASAMIEDFGGNIKPYLLSFWESARHFPGLDTDGMTSVEDSKKEFDALIAKSDNEVNTEQDNTDDNSLRGTPRGRADSTAPASEPSQGTLAGISTEDVSPVPKTGDTTGQAQPSSRASVSSDESARRSGAQSERSAGNRAATVHPTDTRSERVTPKPEQAVTADNTATDYPIAPPQSQDANQDNSQDFTITEDDEVGKGGLKTKFKQNLEAIKLLKQLQRENRQATKDEQKILTKWVGWGGLKAAFRRGDGSTVNGWAKEVEQLEAVLTPDELDAALNSTIAAHYTEPKIVKAMWKAVEKLGFKGGRVLEPSIGSGIFLGMLPVSLRKSTAFYGTELDTITGGLAQQLYPTAAIKVMGFQDYSLQDGFFKVAIGNPPFANIKITDLDRKHLSGLSLHNYFFAKSLDALEPNGVLAMVVTSRLLDGADPKTRNYLFANAELLMAVRLPNNAFKENANTDVTTDIIFLRKRTKNEREKGSDVGIMDDFDYRSVGTFTDKNGTAVPLNNYFIKNPDHMLGEFGNFGTMYARGENGIETALVAPKGQNTLELLNKVLDKLPTGVITKHNKSDTLIVESMVKNIPEVKVGSMFEQDGNIYERTPDSMGDRQAVAVELPSQKAVDRVTGLIGLRSILSDVRQMQLSSNTDETVLEQRRAELNKAYDQFVKEHGHINSDANKRLFKEDPSWSQLSALEDNYDKGVSAAVSKNTGEPVKKPSAKKAAILERRTQYPFAEVTQVSSAKDGMVETLNSLGRLDIKRISQLYGKDEQTVIDELGDLIYQDPVNGWVTADNYLSGNVKAKLAQARDAMATHGSDYERNIKALEQVQPQDIEAVDIEVRAGAHWIPANHITDFLKDVLGATGLQGVPTYSKFDNDWTLPKFIESAEAGTQFGTNRKSVRDIVTAAMNGKQVTVYDQIDRDTKVVNQEATNDANQKVEAVKRAWNDWIWMDDNRRDELAGLYNDIFNTDINQTYDGSHLKLLGKVDDNVIELRPTQKNAIWRITQNPTTLLDHVVGAGKTFTMVAAAMELRRMGLASKPMIVVPNHLVGQWGKEFIQLYPNANILVATKKDFEAANRKRLVARIANGDWDAVIVAHSSFGKIAVSPEFEAEFIKQQIQEITTAIEDAKKDAGKSSNARDLANRRLKLEEKYKKLTASENRDTDNLYWDELGVDALMLDEAHEFKNLAYTTSSMNRVAGLGNQSGSQKAMDLFMKIQQLKQNPSSRIVFATGTPISNSMAEMYTMQRYLDMKRMQTQGISGFDAWAKTFGEVVNDWELSASGKYQMKSRFAKFVNMPELMQSYLGFADVINRDDINDSLKSQGKKLPVPKIKGGAPQNTVVERSDAQADFIGVPRIENGSEIYGEHTLIYRAEHLPKGQDAKKKGADNMLKIIGEARKAALDMRILDPNAQDFAGSKVNKAVENIMRIWRDTAADKGTQLVFCDLSTPKGSNNKEQAKLNELVRLADEGNEDAIAQLEKYTPDELDAIMNVNNFSVYDDMKQKLIAQGIPENEIAFIHDANTELQKDELFSKVRSGRIRVLLGSTSKMGAGTNVQTRLVALHHMDAPWRPSDLEQREGRIIRQGNELYAKDPENFEVEIHRYATEQTMDAMQWQIIENKAKFIEQVRKGDIKTRVIEDIEGEAANAGAMKAAASGNPLILEEMALKKQLNDLDSDKTRHDREQHRIKATIKRTKDGIDSLENEQSRYTTLSQAKTPSDLDVTINGKNYKQGQEGARVEAGKAIVSQAIKASMSKEKLSVGQYGDFTISAAANPTNRDSAILSLDYRGESIAMEVKHNDPAGGIITKLINRIKEIPDKLQQLKADLEKSIKAIPKLESQLKPWGKEAELDDIRRKHTEVMDALKPKKDGQAQPTDKPQYSKRELLAPNGKPSNLTPEQYAQVRTPEFKAWFGDWENNPANASKVVDKNGEPLVVYHGTTKPINTFNTNDFGALLGKGSYFTTDKAEAAQYSQDSNIIASFINIKNPRYANSVMENIPSQAEMAAQGFDGVILNNDNKVKWAIAHNPNQIKSATNNTGAFDPNNDDIRYSKNTKGATNTTPTQVRDTLVKQFGEKTIKALEDAGVLHIKQLSDFVDENGNLSIADDAEGFYHDGKVVLVADNIDPNKIMDVYLHEMGGHAGLQAMLSPNAYANLMQTFYAMVARGDEIALRAKQRAELASENQDQATTEYLPYLLSEISNAQAKTPFIKRLLDRFVGAVRAWVYAKTGVRMNLTHADILGLAELTIKERARNIERTAKLIKQVNKQYSQPATNQSISYSRRFAPVPQTPIPKKPTLEQAKNWLNKQWATKWVSWDTFSRLIRRNIATPQHVAITHADYKKFWDLVQQRINYTNYEAANAVGLVPEILDKRLIIGQNKKDIEAVSKVIFDGTMNDVVYGDTELTRKGLTDKQIDLYRRVRQAIDESVEKMAIDVLANSAKGTGLISLDEILRIKEAVVATGGNVHTFNTAMQQAVNAKIQAMQQAGIIDAVKAAKLTTMFGEVAKQMDSVADRVISLQDEGYAPLMRFGSYAVAVNDSKGDLVLYELYETKREQQKALHDLKKNPDYAGMTFNQNVLNPGDYQQFTNKGLNPETVMLFANELGLSSDEANQAYLKVAIAQQSALKRLIHRKKVAGFSEDLPRVLSAFVMSNARHSSRMLYNGDIQKAQQAIKDGDLRGEAQNLFENMENPKEEFASFRSMMFHWNMGFSPAFGLLNMTQPFIQTIPQLTIYDGVIGAHKSVLNGIRKAMASQVLEDAKGLGIAKNAKDFVDTIPSYMRDDYIRMTKEGHLDPQNVWLLQGLERGKAGVASGALGMVGQAAGYISEATETINRRATMYAALEIAHKLGAAKLKAKGFDSAYDFAVTTIQQTQGVYNKGNRSGLARSTGPASKFGAVIMMYKQFSINLIEQQIRMGQQKQGKALATAWVYQWLLAGAAGLIAADDLKDIIETIAFKFGYALNTDRKMQEFFIDTFGKEQGNDFYQMFNYGVLSSVSPIDFHGRSSAGNIIPATGLLHPSKAGDQKTEATEALGVGANWIGSMFDAGKLMMNGQFRDAMVTAAPRYVRDSVQAYEIATTGSMRDKNGRKVMDMTQGDAVAKALQFNPKSNAQRGRESMLNWQDKKLIENVKGDFTVKLAEAIASKDQAAQDKVMADIDKWNAKNDKQYQMDKTKITKSATDKAKKRDFTADERQTLPKSLEEYVNSLKKTGLNTVN